MNQKIAKKENYANFYSRELTELSWDENDEKVYIEINELS